MEINQSRLCACFDLFLWKVSIKLQAISFLHMHSADTLDLMPHALYYEGALYYL